MAAAGQLNAAVSPEFAELRAKIGKHWADDFLVLFGNKESSELQDGFYQDTHFLYITGREKPGANLLVMPEWEKGSPVYERGIQLPREIRFLPQRGLTQKRYTGSKLGTDQPGVAAVTRLLIGIPAERVREISPWRLVAHPRSDIGGRVKNTVLVTHDGVQIPGAALPTGPDEMKRALAQRN